MPQSKDIPLIAAAALVFLGALLHLAIPIGGPEWYAFFGAPPRMVTMVEAGSLRPAVICVVIASLLWAVAAYGFSGAGVIRRLPALKVTLGLIGAALTLRGLSFVPIALWRPQLLRGLCGDCNGASPFLLLTSLLCLVVGIAYLSGAFHARRR